MTNTHDLFAALETGRRAATGESNAQDPGAEFARFFAERLADSSRNNWTAWVQPDSDTAA